MTIKGKRLEVREEEARAIRRALLLLDRKEGRVPPNPGVYSKKTSKRPA